MTLLWIVAAVNGLLACAALLLWRRTATRLAELTAMYWELKYDHGELKAEVKGSPGGESKGASAAAPVQGFVPLGDLKRRT